MGNCLSNKEVEGSVHAQKRVTKIAENNTHKRQNYTFGFKTDFHSHYELSKTVLGRGSYGNQPHHPSPSLLKTALQLGFTNMF